ncbi:MAG: GH3 auxin-responsive promoter family protein [Hyphomonadaceae bacterium]|nr:GH3 auxin-responsive promoter family protein [Hyphomonadaceae bacterium]
MANTAFVIGMDTLGRRARAHLLFAAKDPEKAQHAALMSIVEACRETEQGRGFGLGQVADVDAFRRAVPIQTYEDMRPAIDRQIASGALEIAPEKPIMYARSSGTTGSPKYIPVTTRVLKQLRTAQRAMAFTQHEALRAFSGRLVGLGGAKSEEILPDGTPAGATTGLIYETMPRFMRKKYVVPPSIFSVTDYQLKYEVIARLAAGADDVTVFATANPSTLLRLMDVANRDLARIVNEVADGAFAGYSALPPEVAREIKPLLAPDQRRANELGRVIASGRPAQIGDLWPKLRAVVTWLGGGCALAAEAVRKQLPAGARMVDAGYVASEMRGTIVVDIERGLALPLLSDVFFEFVPVEVWDRGERQTLLLHELAEGQDYHVIVSSVAGLLRYHMNDVVRATARIGATPTLAFIRKGRGMTNITGEKLSEDQVHAAMGRLSPKPAFFVVLADAALSGYRAYIESPNGAVVTKSIAVALDDHLSSLNIEYAAKRASGRLHAVNVRLLRSGAGEAYHRHCVDVRKQREAQAKVLALQTVEECDFDFAAFEIADAAAVTDLH